MANVVVCVLKINGELRMEIRKAGKKDLSRFDEGTTEYIVELRR